MSNFAEDYIPVAERISAFYGKHPDGSLQSELVELNETRVTIRAFAYRSPEDPRPGIGISSLEIPGKTPYTRGSEIENCETSAWGRAIAALGFEVKRGVASAEEVRNKSNAPASPGRAAEPSSPSQARPARSLTAVPEPDEYPDDGYTSAPQGGKGWSFKELAAAAEDQGIAKTRIYQTADQLFGKGTKVTDLQPDQREQIAFELGLVG